MDAEPLPGETEIEWADRTYHPVHNGIHVCGQGRAEGCDVPVTVANYAIRKGQARAVFERAKAELSTTDDPDDICIDLQIDGDCVDDFTISRQMLGRLALIVRDHAQ